MLPEESSVGIALVAAFTAGYGITILVGIVVGPHVPSLTGVLCLALAVLLWRRTVLAWAGGLAFYGLWAIDGVGGLVTQGPEHLPMTLLGVIAVGYLLARRAAFDRTEIVPRSEPASMPRR